MPDPLCCGESPQQKCDEAIRFNTSRLQKIYSKEKILLPHVVYPVSFEKSKYRYKVLSNNPTPEQIDAMIADVEAVQYWPYDGYYTLTTGEPVNACISRIATQ